MQRRCKSTMRWKETVEGMTRDTTVEQRVCARESFRVKSPHAGFSGRGEFGRVGPSIVVVVVSSSLFAADNVELDAYA